MFGMLSNDDMGYEILLRCQFYYFSLNMEQPTFFKIFNQFVLKK